MKLNRKWLLIALGILIVANIAVFVIDKTVDYKVNITYIYSQESDASKYFTSLMHNVGSSDKASFQIVGPNHSKYGSLMEGYAIKGTSALLVIQVDENGYPTKLVNKITSPSIKDIDKEIGKYVNIKERGGN